MHKVFGTHTINGMFSKFQKQCTCIASEVTVLCDCVSDSVIVCNV